MDGDGETLRYCKIQELTHQKPKYIVGERKGKNMFHVYQVSTRKYLGVVNAANMMDACLIGFQTFGVKYSDLVASVTLNPWG